MNVSNALLESIANSLISNTWKSIPVSSVMLFCKAWQYKEQTIFQAAWKHFLYRKTVIAILDKVKSWQSYLWWKANVIFQAAWINNCYCKTWTKFKLWQSPYSENGFYSFRLPEKVASITAWKVYFSWIFLASCILLNIKNKFVAPATNSTAWMA